MKPPAMPRLPKWGPAIEHRPWRHIPRPPAGCVCGEGLLLYVPPGEVAYPCPVHPERGVRGADTGTL